ncbi:MAG TPA: DNA translocase FtsK 4TM domain-containing protein [Planctomycetota bacterium]|nr:DNA translocase FtsK 4TM domain-containing protein [Planctomycetota bacterium]HPY75149.1 DNA translocase FtsK 4TM domain-containing protein [Planctomycetota bacterium]HQB00756.1 DNA translocase FtsK 4TM domain-containing protein [Planctomycetota bacterium]HRU52745.1 DNA translocase FtsK 4TM domain-containing protein [Planctomycetota bacterium]
MKKKNFPLLILVSLPKITMKIRQFLFTYASPLPYVILFCILLLCLVTYHPQDMQDIFPNKDEIQNYTGVVGAKIAYFCFQQFGIMAYSILLIPIILYIIAKKEETTPRSLLWFIYISIFLWLCTILSYFQPQNFQSFHMPSLGGLTGNYLLFLLQKHTKNVAPYVLFLIGIGLFAIIFSYLLEYYLNQRDITKNKEKS